MLKSVFVLERLHALPSGEKVGKNGIYRSHSDALTAIERVKIQPLLITQP